MLECAQANRADKLGVSLAEDDEGKVVDDERPPFADDEAPVAADPALLQELQEGGDDDAAGDDDYKPGHESDVDEEFQAD